MIVNVLLNKHYLAIIMVKEYCKKCCIFHHKGNCPLDTIERHCKICDVKIGASNLCNDCADRNVQIGYDFKNSRFWINEVYINHE